MWVGFESRNRLMNKISNKMDGDRLKLQVYKYNQQVKKTNQQNWV